MSEIAIKVENLGKQYKIGGEKASYKTLRESLMEALKAPFQRAAGLLRGESYSAAGLDKTIWALKDVNLEINQGEVVGIIGANGAGKSTLLKVLSRITEPSQGRALIHGRVGSLLEVGTGFHPELTGRENIYLNGSILGMTRDEIDLKFSEIVDFSGIEQFLDTPVKHYSSGMRVRLAFSIAAHLDPEILLVDEVLAVGDAVFQEKSLGKMSDVASGGRTVLFVSHNMGAVETMCQRCILLQEGEIIRDSKDVKAVIDEYIQPSFSSCQSSFELFKPTTDYFQLVDFSISSIDKSDGQTRIFSKNESIFIEIKLEIFLENSSLNIGYALYDFSNNDCIWWSFCQDEELMEIQKGSVCFTTEIPKSFLNDGTYRIDFLAALHNQRWLVGPGHKTASIVFDVKGGNIGTSLINSTSRPGYLLPVFSWSKTNC